jgi:hypothetical protein
MLTFAELAEARRSLHRFCLLHVSSLRSLQSGISFKLLQSEPDLEPDKATHLTTTATCYSSLFESPPRFRPASFADLAGC